MPLAGPTRARDVAAQPPAAAPIPFNRPFTTGNEHAYIQQAIENEHIAGGGPFTSKCERALEEILGVPKVLLTTSCTDALEMSALLVDVQPGDEVIVPSFTFPSAVNAFVLRGASPVFIDIRADTLNLDESRLERLIGRRTCAIVPVHYGGVACEMDAIRQIADLHGIPVVEDNAHGLFGRYRGRHLGSFGSLATLSFHASKNISCGEGGALVINDPRYCDRAEILRDKGTNRSRFFRGQVDRYTWVDVGSSFMPADLLAAFLYAQIEAREQIQCVRRRIWTYYFSHLAEWADRMEVRLPRVPAHCEQPYHIFYLLMPSEARRDALIAHLKDRGIQSAFHYMPLHLSEMGRICSAKELLCPISEEASQRIIRLPFYNQLTQNEQERVVDAILEFRS